MEKETISHADFKEISERALDQRKKNQKEINLDWHAEAIEAIVKSFPTEETQKLCRKICHPFDIKKIIFLLKEIKEEDFKILEEKTEEWVEIIVNEFREKRNKDFHGMDSGLAKHIWATPLQALKGVIEMAGEEREKSKF
ncbi:hypothetical protein KKA09_01295 [Patescibacteria group bacterium]|nr:hypothetical protein [Patescibacteria group bacterium]